MEQRTAIVFGATGLIGTSLINELIVSARYDQIMIFVRKRSPFYGREKIRETIVNFEKLSEIGALITGDDLFICLGTTIKKAGSVKKMEEIDRDLPVKIASIASDNGIKRIAVVSSIGAAADSANYYLRIKGEMEQGIMALNFDTIAIVRPSMLLGKRNEKRIKEYFGKMFLILISPLLFGKLLKYRGISGTRVAKAMMKILENNHPAKKIFESNELKKISLQ